MKHNEWDGRYASREQLFSTEADGTLVELAEDLPPAVRWTWAPVKAATASGWLAVGGPSRPSISQAWLWST